MTELKPCPFCGGAGKYHDSYVEDDVCEYVSCTRCNASTPLMYKKGESIEWWNRRPSPWHTGTPTEEGTYLVTDGLSDYAIAYFDGEKFSTVYFPNHAKVIAWQRIEPCKEAST